MIQAVAAPLAVVRGPPAKVSERRPERSRVIGFKRGGWDQAPASSRAGRTRPRAPAMAWHPAAARRLVRAPLRPSTHPCRLCFEDFHSAATRRFYRSLPRPVALRGASPGGWHSAASRRLLRAPLRPSHSNPQATMRDWHSVAARRLYPALPRPVALQGASPGDWPPRCESGLIGPNSISCTFYAENEKTTWYNNFC